MCGGLHGAEGERDAIAMGLVITETDGNVVIKDPRLTDLDVKAIIKKAQEGLGKEDNKTIWLKPRDTGVLP